MIRVEVVSPYTSYTCMSTNRQPSTYTFEAYFHVWQNSVEAI